MRTRSSWSLMRAGWTRSGMRASNRFWLRALPDCSPMRRPLAQLFSTRTGLTPVTSRRSAPRGCLSRHWTTGRRPSSRLTWSSTARPVPSVCRTDRDRGAEHLLGARYFPLRHRFRAWPEKIIMDRVGQVLVTVGGEDVHGLLRPLMASARSVFADARIIGVCGTQSAEPRPVSEDIRYAPPDYPDLVRSADVIVCGGGQTLVEAAATGTPAAALLLGDDQLPQLRAVAAALACIDAGSWEMPAAIRETNVRSVLHTLRDVSVRARMSGCGRALVDGQGAERVAGAIASLARRGAQ